MTVTALDTKTALIVIDLQKGLVSLPSIHPIKAVMTHVSTMAAAFRAQGLPVVLVNVPVHRRSGPNSGVAITPFRKAGPISFQSRASSHKTMW